jgi:hypothetical protein
MTKEEALEFADAYEKLEDAGEDAPELLNKYEEACENLRHYTSIEEGSNETMAPSTDSVSS